jgi:hypothetical protein
MHVRNEFDRNRRRAGDKLALQLHLLTLGPSTDTRDEGQNLDTTLGLAFPKPRLYGAAVLCLDGINVVSALKCDFHSHSSKCRTAEHPLQLPLGIRRENGRKTEKRRQTMNRKLSFAHLPLLSSFQCARRHPRGVSQPMLDSPGSPRVPLGIAVQSCTYAYWGMLKNRQTDWQRRRVERRKVTSESWVNANGLKRRFPDD